MTDVCISDALKAGCDMLAAGSPSPKADARFLLCYVLGQNDTYLYTWPDKLLSAEQYHHYQSLLERRKQGEPVAYIMQERGFWTLTLKTAECTLIPREETECLVEFALELLPDRPAKVLDLGTGTGAIALALASERAQWQVYACDYNDEAVKLAQENATNLGLTRVNICQSDWFGAYAGHEQSFDMILSNPPYIAPDDPHLTQGDLRFEPISALAADDQGFSDIFAIVDNAKRFLKPGGWLLLEHGFEQGPRIVEYLSAAGYSEAATQKDLAGLDRFSVAKLP